MSATMDWPRKWRLGVPYQGSKNQIAREIISILPRGKRFVDLFAGGCAMTHAAMISGKYDTFLANDLHGFGLRLFMDAIAGKCNGRWREWVSREEFMAKRDVDPLVALCWSFGNNQAQYLYGEDKEAVKRQAHETKAHGCQSFVQTESLERLQALERLHSDFGKYDDFKFQEGDVVYCDPPYACVSETSGGYRFMKRRGMEFDNSAFWRWVDNQPFPIFVSEYSAPSGFTSLWRKQKLGLFKKTQSGEYHNHNEHLFIADRYADRYQTDLFFGLANV